MAPAAETAGYDLPRPHTTLRVDVLAGDPPALVVVPGVMADAAGWAATATAAADGHEVHIVNRRGRTPSGPLGPDHHLDAEIDDVRAVLDGIPGSKHLVGWSYGALIALEAAIDRDDLATVVAYEPVSRPFAPDATHDIRDALAAGDPDRAVELINTDVSGYSREHVDVLRGSTVWPRLCELALPLGDELRAIDRFTPRYDRYRTIDAAVTLILGERNLGDIEPYGPPFARFRDALPHAAVVVLPGCGHLAHIEAPDLLGRHIGDAIGPARPPRA